LKKIPDLYENWKYTNAEIKKNINLFLKKWKKIPCMVWLRRHVFVFFR